MFWWIDRAVKLTGEVKKYGDKRVERHSNIYKPLGISDVYYCLVILGDEFELNGKKSERVSVAKRLNNASGKRICLSTLLY